MYQPASGCAQHVSTLHPETQIRGTRVHLFVQLLKRVLSECQERASLRKQRILVILGQATHGHHHYDCMVWDRSLSTECHGANHQCQRLHPARRRGHLPIADCSFRIGDPHTTEQGVQRPLGQYCPQRFVPFHRCHHHQNQANLPSLY